MSGNGCPDWRAITVLVVASLALDQAAANEHLQTDATNQWVAPLPAIRKVNPVALSGSSIALGKKLYVKECLACHGTSGKGDGPKAPELKVNPGDLSSPKTLEQTDGALFW